MTVASLAVGCSLFVISIYITGVESDDARSTIGNAKKNEDQMQHDLSVYFRPMLGKRDPEVDDPRPLSPTWDDLQAAVAGAELHRADVSRDYPEKIDHPLVLRWYTPRLGKRATYFTPRLGKRDWDNDVTEDVPEYDSTRIKGKEDKIWKVVGMFNPRLGRSQSDIANYELTRDDLKNNVNFSSDRE